MRRWLAFGGRSRFEAKGEALAGRELLLPGDFAWGLSAFDPEQGGFSLTTFTKDPRRFKEAVTRALAFARAVGFPIIPCDLCGSQDGLQRAQIKALLDQWEKNAPGRRSIMFKALRNVQPSHLVDTDLFDFSGLFPKTEVGRDID